MKRAIGLAVIFLSGALWAEGHDKEGGGAKFRPTTPTLERIEFLDKRLALLGSTDEGKKADRKKLVDELGISGTSDFWTRVFEIEKKRTDLARTLLQSANVEERVVAWQIIEEGADRNASLEAALVSADPLMKAAAEIEQKRTLEAKFQRHLEDFRKSTSKEPIFKRASVTSEYEAKTRFSLYAASPQVVLERLESDIGSIRIPHIKTLAGESLARLKKKIEADPDKNDRKNRRWDNHLKAIDDMIR